MTDDLDELHRTIEPLPGGVLALRRRLRATPPRTRRVAWLAAAAAATCAIVLAWQMRPRPHPDRGAIERLFAADATPHPDAIALGLVVRPQHEQAADARIADDRVVFRWVEPGAASNESNDAPFQDNPIDPRDPAHQVDPR